MVLAVGLGVAVSAGVLHAGKPAAHEHTGPPRYYVGAFLFLVMLALPIKMVLRWLFNLKYIVHIQEIFFNV